MDAGHTARGAALRALIDIDERGAYAAIARDRALREVRLSERDRALATQLVYGVTKMRKTLDYVLGSFAARSVDKMDSVVRNALRIGAYQVLYLSQVPAPSAVNESVELARGFEHEGAGAFVNAVLRTLVRERARVVFPDADTRPVEHIAVRYSHPEWMVSRWLRRFGFEQTVRLCEANNEDPPITVRVNALKTTRAKLLERLSAAGFDVRPSPYVPEGIEVHEGAGLFCHPSYTAGEFFVQDPSSMLVPYVLAPSRGERVLDVAAAPGGKTTHIAERMQDRGEVVAIDVHEHRARLLEENAKRLGIGSIRTVVGDAASVLAEDREMTSRHFDRALVDPPCTGTGVLRRRPDLRWRRRQRDMADLAEIQIRLLSSAATLVKPGGAVVYSTCSIEWEENAGIVERFLAGNPDFYLEPARSYLPREFATAFPHQGLPYVETLPHVHSMDGFFIARLVRQASNERRASRKSPAGVL